MLDKYKLEESTVALFIKYFDNYLLMFADDEIVQYGDKLQVSAIIALRLACKFNET